MAGRPRVRAPYTLLTGFDHVVGDERVEVAADGGLGEAEALGEVGDGGGTVVQDRPRDPVAG